MDNGYEVRQSKIYFAIGCISAVIVIAFILSISLWLMIFTLLSKDVNIDEKILVSVSSVDFMCFGFVLLAMFVYTIYQYQYQIDIYLEDKFIRKLGKKVIFELEYSKIKDIKVAYFSLFIFFEKPIIKANGKKGPRTIIGHYSVNDINCVMQIFSNYINNSYSD